MLSILYNLKLACFFAGFYPKVPKNGEDWHANNCKDSIIPRLIGLQKTFELEEGYKRGVFDVDIDLFYENESGNERINFTPSLLATMGGCQPVIEKLIDLGARINQVIYDMTNHHYCGDTLHLYYFQPEIC